MDEIRMGGTCAACRGRNMGELLGECITKQTAVLRKYIPGVEVLVWSDMLDPHHNAHGTITSSRAISPARGNIFRRI